jgi:serine/threonine protein kinase
MQYEEGDIQRRVDLAHEEYRRMKRVADHPNVVKVNAFEILESTRQVCIFMEYFPEGDLKQLIATIAESPDPQLIDSNGQLRLRNPAEVTAGLAVSVFFQLCSALEYCETGFLYATSSKSGVWARKPSQAPKNWKALFHRDIKPENSTLFALHP